MIRCASEICLVDLLGEIQKLDEQGCEFIGGPFLDPSLYMWRILYRETLEEDTDAH